MNQKLLRKSLIITLLLGLFYIGLSTTYAQDDNAEISSNHQAVTPTPTPSAVPDELDPNGLDRASDDIKDHHKALETMMGELTKGEVPRAKSKDAEKTILDQEDAIKELAMKINTNISPEKMKKMKIHQALEVALAPMQKLSEQQLMIQLKENVAGTHAQKIFEAVPKLTLLCVRLIKDPKAIPDMSRILENRDRLIKFSAVMITSIIVGFILKSMLSKKDRPFHVDLFYFFIRVLLMLGLRLFIVYFFFADELDRSFTIFFNTFFS